MLPPLDDDDDDDDETNSTTTDDCEDDDEPPPFDIHCFQAQNGEIYVGIIHMCSKSPLMTSFLKTFMM